MYNYYHPLRQTLIEELHARPFIAMNPGARIAYFVVVHDLKKPDNDPTKTVNALCKHFKIDPPKQNKRFYLVHFGEFTFKWECHNEFSSFLLYEGNRNTVNFEDDIFDNFPDNWLKNLASRVLTSALIEIPKHDNDARPIHQSLEPYRKFFIAESTAVAAVLEEAAVIATDFQIDPQGHIRFLLIPRAKIGNKRLGRIVQRIVEIETYKTASLLALPIAHSTSKTLPQMEEKLLPIMQKISEKTGTAQIALDELLELSGEVEQAIANSTFRFNGAKAYSEIVNQRIKILRETRVGGFQLFSEFMLRRYEPSMQTIFSTWGRLLDYSNRLERTANLLRTRVDVNNAESQKELLASMNQRTKTQLRLQETVEGFSVVAISYYTVSLLGYILAPIAKKLDIDKGWVLAGSIPFVVIAVWIFIHRVRKHVIAKNK